MIYEIRENHGIIDSAKARDLMQAYLDGVNKAKRAQSDDPEHECIIIEESTREEDVGWVFYWNTRRWLKTRELMDGIIGNPPVFIGKFDGSVHVARSDIDYSSIDQIIKRYRTQMSRGKYY